MGVRSVMIPGLSVIGGFAKKQLHEWLKGSVRIGAWNNFPTMDSWGRKV